MLWIDSQTDKLLMAKSNSPEIWLAFREVLESALGSIVMQIRNRVFEKQSIWFFINKVLYRE